MKFPLSTSVAMCLLWFSASALAEPGDPGESGTSLQPRLLLGMGGHMGFGQENQGAGYLDSGGAVGIGLYVRAGAQFGDTIGVEAEVTGATILLTSYLRGALTLDWTPEDWFTLALGPTVREDNEVSWNPQNAQSVGATMRLDFHINSSRSLSGARGAFTLGLVGEVGATVGVSGECCWQTGLAWGLYGTAGYAWY